MMEHKIGETLIVTDENNQHHKLLPEEIFPDHSCEGCHLYENCIKFRESLHKSNSCQELPQEDGRYAIIKEVK